jgi:two-component system, OmpR family, sensor histidine kinase KdpD
VSSVRLRSAFLAAVEAVVAVGVASLAVAVLETAATVDALAVVYLPAILFVAVRRGQWAAVGAAALAVVAFNFFFVEPRWGLHVSDSEDLVALAVFLVCGLVVGRLAGELRDRSAEARERAEVAEAREHEAALLADVARALLVGGRLERQLGDPGSRLNRALAEAGVRVAITGTPEAGPTEIALPLRLRDRRAWLYADRSAGWTQDVLARVLDPLAGILDVALERERIADEAADVEATRRADVTKTTILHAVSHDFRSPLTAIATAAAGLRAGGLGADEREELETVIAEEAARLGRLVGDLLDLSRIEAGAVHPQADWCDVGEVVARAVEQNAAGHPDHEVTVRADADVPLIRADPAQLERVFMNLLDNAVKFSPPGEEVEVTVTALPGQVVVRVTNGGAPIPAAERRAIFEPFHRGAGGEPGAGLGLAIVRGFVEANGGRIVAQAPPGGGTSFAVSLPAAERPAVRG